MRLPAATAFTSKTLRHPNAPLRAAANDLGPLGGRRFFDEDRLTAAEQISGRSVL